jgi:three-Cys-motif partner protein
LNCAKLLEELNIDTSKLDDKKQQTDYKIRFVSKYVELWALVSENRQQVENLNFIDCMCNAGIYRDGDLTTAMETLLFFYMEAPKHPEKTYNIYLNDHSQERIEINKQLVCAFMKEGRPANLFIYYNQMDVNEYLNNLGSEIGRFDFKSAIVLFVDPYDLRTVKISDLAGFINNHYCEVLFNFFVSDYVRNKDDSRIAERIGSSGIQNKEELTKAIQSSLRVGKTKYVFSYCFHNTKNAELYQIVFATPNIKGLEKLKEALWDTFDGKEYHRNYDEDPAQQSLFSESLDIDLRLSSYANQAKSMLLEEFEGQVIPYTSINSYIVENTMLMPDQILRNVVKPLVESGQVSKLGDVGKGNYKNDRYKVASKEC